MISCILCLSLFLQRISKAFVFVAYEAVAEQIQSDSLQFGALLSFLYSSSIISTVPTKFIH